GERAVREERGRPPWSVGRVRLAGTIAAAALGLAAPRGGRADDGQPKLGIAQPVFDFGDVDQGAKVEHTFALTNTGDAELRIDHVKSSCGCTVAVASERDVPPGGEGRVTVTLDTARMSGRGPKIVTV